ncbi:hypothetical protein [Deinococcus hopiensis]|uniref:Uncharacterized protein n=1 Tax=Deinococcus hopiensis KR-140 TaxID=695939 RepID=A0A1W1UJ98_9DEIO|nr:hypothetical protein [Deinococcus hopiensis]SMB81119.1 hypothetical protein SAMN00790413_04471 [Deinococcus hopiensis KR-140]
MIQTQTRAELHRFITQTLIQRGMSLGSAKVTADGFLLDLEDTSTLRLTGFGQIERLAPDCYRVDAERPRLNYAHQEKASSSTAAEIQHITESFMQSGTPEPFARNAAHIIVNRRYGKRVD